MQPKKQPRPKGTPVPVMAGKGPRRPVGIQALGPIRYEQLRRALHQLGGAAER
ncbi:hypothetical protein [Vitiosangium sp. GDMCC 1.1324]|uniref:hypothetical protein n=1 Tax=Vitiosangium sp. (strain GDMCC 1.1324) TaxID=2138576 RepID=UPI00130EC7C6|nr:hypothetical protein [Vitiosangium sp. GDMCC 1.1324]